jgi:DNA-binding NarL/FixJ family response regulator
VATTPSNSATVRDSMINTVVIEGDVLISELLGSWLKDEEGLSCVGQFHDAENVCAEMTERRPDVALVDINFPSLGGADCIRKLKMSSPETQLIALTVYEDSDRIFDALQAGATGYLLKTTPRATLVDTVREVHAGGSPMTSNIARKVVQSFRRPKHAGTPDVQLSVQENEILALLAQGYFSREIAALLGIDPSTVSRSIRRVYEKLHASEPLPA